MSGIFVHIPLHLRIQFHDWNSVSNSLKVYYEDNNMTIQNQFSKIIVLIDAEIAQAGKTDQILKDVSTYGRIVTKRAYANWAKSSVKPWEEIVKKYAIRTIQQFDFASGKNASDI